MDEVEVVFRVVVLLLWSVVEGLGMAIPVGLWAGVTEMGVEPMSIVLGEERDERGVSMVGGMSEIVRLEGVWGSVPGGRKEHPGNIILLITRSGARSLAHSLFVNRILPVHFRTVVSTGDRL